MPAGRLEYGVLYYIEEGPTREHIYDCVRLGHSKDFVMKFTFRGKGRDWIGSAKAHVEGIHQRGNDSARAFIMGRLATTHDYQNQPHDEIWHKAFFFAQYVFASRGYGRILLGERSFLESPLKRFKPFEEIIEDL